MSSCDSIADRVVRRRFTDTERAFFASRQDNLCACCEELLEVTFQVDHITPIRAGGNNDPANLHALCPNCHARKTREEPAQIKKISKFPESYRFCWRCEDIYSCYFRHHCSKESWYKEKVYLKPKRRK